MAIGTLPHAAPRISNAALVRSYSTTSNALSDIRIRLTTGNRIVRIGDDTASETLADQLQAKTVSFRTALQNSAKASSLLQVIYAALDTIGGHLDTQRGYAVQSASTAGTTDQDRAYLNHAFQDLRSVIDEIVNRTTFDSLPVLDGSITGSSAFQFVVGDPTATNILTVSIASATSAALYAGTTPTLDTAANATSAITQVDSAIALLQQTLGSIGGYLAQLDYGSDVLAQEIGGSYTARGALLDTDVIAESARYREGFLQQQTAAAVIAQSLRFNSNLLNLVQGI